MNSAICDLIGSLQGVFKTLRMLAFIGAAFIIANWAWGWITAGKFSMKDDGDKPKIIAMIIGLAVLFLIGAAMSFLIGNNSSALGLNCIVGGWN
ncbi:MAG: hypothetical protein LBO08_02355 [Rickettsiales bacterium]|jgi:hypothetical protein|nr:hypothetical protein [Rickettsiales bacterium]